MERAQAEEEKLKPHSNTAKLLHWGFIAIFIYGLAKQLDEVVELEDAALLKEEMWFASIFLVVLAIRFIYMQFTRPTVLSEQDTPTRHYWLARAVHLGMYLSLSMIAVTGLVIGGLYGTGTKSGPAMEIALVVHEVFVITSYYLIAGHVLAAIYHRKKGGGVWESMLPKRTRL